MKLAVLALLPLACSGPERRPLAAPTPPDPAPVVVPPPPPMQLPAQRFADDPGYTFGDPARATKLAAAFPKIDAAMTAELARQNVAGVAVGVVIDGKLAYAKGFGITDTDTKAAPDADTLYAIGSISKSFTALAILTLRDAGELRLDDPLARWLPAAGGLVYPTRDSPPITLKQLLDHTSGLPRDGDYTKAATEAMFLPQLTGLALENPPGQTWSYSNLGYGLLGLVAGHASKQPLPELLQTRVFGPLGMTSTGFDPKAAKLAPAYLPDGKRTELEALGVVAGAGGIISSVRDMAQYVALQQSAYPPRGGPEGAVVKRATLREAHSTGSFNGARVTPRHGKRGEPAVELGASSYGFGWQHAVNCTYDDVIGHSGAITSYRSAVKLLTWHGVGVIVLTNFANANTNAFADRMIEELAATGAMTRYERHGEVSKAFLASMNGLLAVYNQWDEAALGKVLGRPIDPVEQSELAAYHQLHGTCTALTPTTVTSPVAATFAVTCERGTFELGGIALADGKLVGFVGVSRGVTPPAELATAVKNALALQVRWDDAVFAKTFADPKAREIIKTGSAALYAESGACRVKSYVHEGFDWRFEATCDKGPDRRYDLTLAGPKIKTILTRPLVDGPCPLH
ncbi:MAG: serine hydrolase domain-containing protein [Kofleriaceae bacterium]